MVSETSREAFRELDKETRQIEVLRALREIQPANNKMIAKKLFLGINQVTPRIYELRNQKKFVTFSHKDKCPYTLKNSMFWKLTKLGEDRLDGDK